MAIHHLEDITATGAEFSRVMKGSSGAGLFVGYEDWICCLGYVKSRMTEKDKLDDIKIRRIPNKINEIVGRPILSPSVLKNQVLGRVFSSRSAIEIE